MTFRPAVLVALVTVLLTALVAFAVQLALLGALLPTAGATTGQQFSSGLPLEAANNTRTAMVAGNSGLYFDASRAPAVAQAKALTLNTGNVLAVILNTEDVTSNLRLTLGWLTTQDIRRPATATAMLPAIADPQQTVLLLAGHPRWRDTITQIALGVENAQASSIPPGAFLARTELLPANPVGGARLLATAWFQRDGNIVTPNESANRLLPLALWLALICALSLMIVALIFRKNPERRADALRCTALMLAVGSVGLTLLSARWPGWTVPLGAGAAAAAALLLLDRTFALPLSATQRNSLALLCAGIAVVLSPLVAAVAVVPAIMLCLARSQNDQPSSRWVQVGALLALVPALLLAAVAQGMLPAPSLLNPLTDPTKTLTTVATSAGGLPGIALGMLAMHRLWPAPAQSPRWSGGAVAAAVWALLGAVAVLAIPKIAVLAGGGSTYTALFLPALACIALAVFPKFQAVARTLDETVVAEAKSEQDLSMQALALLESHAERVQATLARREVGAAHAALVQMQRLAPAAQATSLAQLRIALAENDLDTAESAAARLGDSNALSAVDYDALLELAHRRSQQARVIELAPGASQNLGNTRALAMAQLLTSGPAQAVETLSNWSDPHSVARDLAELHLLSDDISAAQQALVNTGISLTEPIGQAYVARLGLRALGAQGPQAQGDAINSLALWHPQLGAAHAAQGELLLRQGNSAGARARFLLALKLDPQLWPLQYRLQQIDATAENSNPASVQTPPMH
jgi:tetratricopeptide (TPR) repeat protein